MNNGMRYAVLNSADIKAIKRYMPSNYTAEFVPNANIIVISGFDVAGWTLDDYVIPRLASGNYYAKEVHW